MCVPRRNVSLAGQCGAALDMGCVPSNPPYSVPNHAALSGSPLAVGLSRLPQTRRCKSIRGTTTSCNTDRLCLANFSGFENNNGEDVNVGRIQCHKQDGWRWVDPTDASASLSRRSASESAESKSASLSSSTVTFGAPLQCEDIGRGSWVKSMSSQVPSRCIRAPL